VWRKLIKFVPTIHYAATPSLRKGAMNRRHEVGGIGQVAVMNIIARLQALRGELEDYIFEETKNG
jgi:hypothetical protein